VRDVVRGQELRQLGLDCLELSSSSTSESSIASTVPSSSLVRISTSITRIVPASTSATSSFAISP
jgi:hypothetical protein